MNRQELDTKGYKKVGETYKPHFAYGERYIDNYGNILKLVGATAACYCWEREDGQMITTLICDVKDQYKFYKPLKNNCQLDHEQLKMFQGMIGWYIDREDVFYHTHLEESQPAITYNVIYARQIEFCPMCGEALFKV